MWAPATYFLVSGTGNPDGRVLVSAINNFMPPLNVSHTMGEGRWVGLGKYVRNTAKQAH
jgi:hypothetical protein